MSILKNIATFKNWYMCYLIRYGIVKKECKLKTKSGIKYFVRPKTQDFKIIKSIYTKNFYIRNFVTIEKGDIVFDVGANIGTFSLLAAQKAYKVYSFEPEPRNYEMLERNIKLNSFSNVIPIMKAVSNSNGFIDFYLYPKNYATGCHSLYVSKRGYSEKIKVETITLKKFLETNNLFKIDFLKLDCEGAEYDIIRSLDKKTASRIQKIAMETHKHYELAKNIYNIPEYLESLGFEVMIDKDDSCYVYAKQRKEQK